MRLREDQTNLAINFAKAMPVGTRCRYYPRLPANEDEFEIVDVESEPWVLGHGAAVVKVSGRSGGVSIKHIFPLGIEPMS